MRYAMHSSWHQFEPPPTPEIDAITDFFGGKRHNKDLNTSGYMTIAESATAKREKEIAEAVHVGTVAVAVVLIYGQQRCCRCSLR